MTKIVTIIMFSMAFISNLYAKTILDHSTLTSKEASSQDKSDNCCICDCTTIGNK